MSFKYNIVLIIVFSLGVYSSDWLKSTGRYLIFGESDARTHAEKLNNASYSRRFDDKKNRFKETNQGRFLAGSRNPYENLNLTESGAYGNANTFSADDNLSSSELEESFSWSLVSRLIRERSYNKAIALLQNYLNLNPESPQAWAMLAGIYEKQNLIENAIDSWLNFVAYENDSSQTAPILEKIKQRFLSMIAGSSKSSADQSWMIDTLGQLVDIRSNDGELHWMLASLYLELEDDYQAQYHALMAANDPAAKTRAEEILAQLNGDVLPEDLNIPLVRYGNQYLVEVTIEDNLALLLLDTGASISGVSSAFVNNHPYIVKDTKPIRLNTASGVETSYLFTVDDLRIQSLVFRNHILALLPMAEQAEFDGLLGVDILGRFDFIIDQDAMLLRLKPRD